MAGFRLVCRQCKTGYRVSHLAPGKAPACRKCGAALTARGKLVLACPSCGARTEPAQVDITRAAPCEACGTPMRAAEQHVPRGQGEPSVSQAGPAEAKASRAHGADTPRGSGPSILPEGGPAVLQEAQLEGTFGKYKIVEQIARGGMGVVYKVYDPQLRRYLALKLLLAGEGATAETLQRFLREARAVAKLRHPNIVAVHEVGEIDGQYYFTMDYVEGRTFDQLIQQGGMPPAEFVGYMEDICFALQTAHDHGIIHRDLKPGNIMLDASTGRPMVMDFGLAKDVTSLTVQSMTGSVFGTPAYMSPEQAHGRTHEIDYRTDIYSMGVILYEGLTGKRPFLGTTVYDTISMVVAEDPPAPRRIAPKSVDASMEAIILRCMAKEPAQRYAQMYDLAADLKAYRIGAPIAVRPLTLPGRVWRKLRRSRLAQAAALAVPLAVAAAVLALALLSRPGYVEIHGEALRSGEPQRMVHAIGELQTLMEAERLDGDERAQALGLVREALDHENAQVGGRALRAAVQVGDGQAVGPLLSVAKGDAYAPERRAEALLAVGELAAQTRDAKLVAELTRLARQADLPEAARVNAVRAADRVGGPSAVGALLDVANDREAPTAVRVEALQGVGGRIVIGNRRMGEVVALCGDPDEQVADAAAQVMGASRDRFSVASLYGAQGGAGAAYQGLGDITRQNAERNRQMMEIIDSMHQSGGRPQEEQPSVLDRVLEKLEAEDPQVRAEAAYDLGRLEEPRAVSALVGALADPDPAVGRMAARSLIALKGQARADQAKLADLLGHEELLVREQAARVLGAYQDAAALAPLSRAARTETSARVQIALAEALARLEEPDAVAALAELYDRAADRWAALACVQALASYGRPAAAHLVHALESDSKHVREAAAHVLKELCGRDFGEDAGRWRAYLEAHPAGQAPDASSGP